jgi:hypothetical protein
MLRGDRDVDGVAWEGFLDLVGRVGRVPWFGAAE